MKDHNGFCCKNMESEIAFFEQKRLDVYGSAYGNIWYDRQHRRYGILHYHNNWNDVSASPIIYCPYCGAKLPKELEDYDMEPFLRTEYGWTDEDCWGYPRRELPEEFKTDEWWKKRGL